MTHPDFRLLDAAAVPDTFGPVADWLEHTPPPRRTRQGPVVAAAVCVVALAACSLPVEVEADLGRALTWTSSTSPDEASQTSRTVFEWVGERPVLGYRVERDDQGRFVHRLAIADASEADASVWRRKLAEDPRVTTAQVETLTESHRMPLAGALLRELGLVAAPERRASMQTTQEGILAHIDEQVEQYGMDLEMVETLPPAAGRDEPRRRFRARYADGSVRESEVGERPHRTRAQALQDRREMIEGMKEFGMDTTLAPSVQEVLRAEGYE